MEPRRRPRRSRSSTVGHDDRIIDALASADRRVLVTLGRDQDVRVWDLGEPPPVVTSSPTSMARCSASRRRPMVRSWRSATATGTVHVLRGDGDDLELTGHDGRVLGVAFLPERPPRDG